MGFLRNLFGAPKKELYVGQEIVNGIGMRLCYCPPGKFVMGIPPDHPKYFGVQRCVEITRGFWMGKYQVTQEEYMVLADDNPSYFKGARNLPVQGVYEDGALEFCRRLTERERAAGMLAKGWEYRVPTEAEWEYVCRAGSRTDYCFGDDEGSLGEYAWYRENSAQGPHPVGEKKPNAWGLHDMHGNVWECCEFYEEHRLPGSVVRRPITQKVRQQLGELGCSTRGGSWASPSSACTSATQAWHNWRGWHPHYGFRVALICSGDY